jgi:predicted enzyme related to lactoylglutathione lyase
MDGLDGTWPQGAACWIDAQLDDLDAGRRFYSELFGWTIDETAPEAGGYLMAYQGGKPVAGLGPKPEGMEMPSVWTTYLAADSADEVHGKVVAAGGQAMMEPFDVMDLGRMFVAADPAGAVFGVWQARKHIGMELVGEHGSVAWNELHTQRYAEAQEFYRQVFDWRYTEIGDGEHFVYSQVTLPDSGPEDLVGGICDDSITPGMPPMSYWLVYLAVDDADAAAEKLVELGGTVHMGPNDSPFGRMLVVSGAQGEMFALIDPETRVAD